MHVTEKFQKNKSNKLMRIFQIDSRKKLIQWCVDMFSAHRTFCCLVFFRCLICYSRQSDWFFRSSSAESQFWIASGRIIGIILFSLAFRPLITEFEKKYQTSCKAAGILKAELLKKQDDLCEALDILTTENF